MLITANNSLLPPCSYQGGKQRVSKQIVDYIFHTTTVHNDTHFFDLCCGSGTITLEIISRGINPKNITMLDVSSWGSFWETIGNGSFSYDRFVEYANKVPKDKSKIQRYMKLLSKEKVGKDECYKYLLLQASSFGGKQIWVHGDEWQNTSFRNFWKPTETSKRRSPVNPMMPMVDELCQRVKLIVDYCQGVNCIHDDIYSILELIPQENCVIYIDPPYINTTGYGFEFDIHDFLSKLFDNTLCPVFVSEKESISDESIRLTFSGDKGAINGNKKRKNEEWLNVYR